MILGSPVRGTPLVPSGDTVRVSPATSPVDANAVKLSLLADGLAGGGGTQALRGTLYRASDRSLKAVSPEVVVSGGDAAKWLTFLFEAAGGVPLTADEEFEYGVHIGPGDVVTLYATSGGGGALATDNYADGTADPRPSGSTNTLQLSGFVSTFVPWTPTGIDDLDIARLPFPDAQRTFAEGAAPVPPSALRYYATCGWHGTLTNPERGAVALVATGGTLTDLVGDRLRVTNLATGKQVYVYCLAESDELPWDISLSRRSFAEVGRLALESTETLIEVLL